MATNTTAAFSFSSNGEVYVLIASNNVSHQMLFSWKPLQTAKVGFSTAKVEF